MNRPDISECVIHLIKAKNIENAYSILKKILSSKQLHAGSGFIRGGFKCICFTETPPNVLAEAPGGALRRYQLIGVLVRKSWLFKQGGRPAIYGSDSEFDQLPDQFKWRHVRYEPTANPPIDLTGEREWRIKTDTLFIDPHHARIVVPNSAWAIRVKKEFEDDSFYDAWRYTTVLGDVAWGFEESFPWKPEILQDSGKHSIHPKSSRPRQHLRADRARDLFQ